MSLPKWIKEHFSWCPGDCRTGGKCKIFEAVEIAWDTLETYRACGLSDAKNAMIRIKEIGE